MPYFWQILGNVYLDMVVLVGVLVYIACDVLLVFKT